MLLLLDISQTDAVASTIESQYFPKHNVRTMFLMLLAKNSNCLYYLYNTRFAMVHTIYVPHYKTLVYVYFYGTTHLYNAGSITLHYTSYNTYCMLEYQL